MKFKFSENVLEKRKMPIAFQIYWALHNIALVIAFVVTIVYWTLLHTPSEFFLQILALSIKLHTKCFWTDGWTKFCPTTLVM